MVEYLFWFVKGEMRELERFLMPLKQFLIVPCQVPKGNIRRCGSML
jgi:hypothetical protein